MRCVTFLSLAVAFFVGITTAALAEQWGPPDTFDIDVLTAYRYGLNHDWAPASCFGRRYCPEDHRPAATHANLVPRNILGF